MPSQPTSRLPGESIAYWQPREIVNANLGITGVFGDVQLIGLDEAVLLLDYQDVSVYLTAALRGDMNLDGVVDTADVAPFVQALTNPAGYMGRFGVDETAMVALGDINQDGVFDTADVARLVRLLVGSGSASVPAPGTLALLGLGTLMLLRRRRTVA